jgi:protein-tyrosine-phosphatase
VREVAVLDREAFGRSFTLPELARIAPIIGTRSPDESVHDWIRRAGSGRRPQDLLGSRPADEVPDPIGRPAREYEATARQLEGLIDTVVDHLFPNGGHKCA